MLWRATINKEWGPFEWVVYRHCRWLVQTHSHRGLCCNAQGLGVLLAVHHLSLPFILYCPHHGTACLCVVSALPCRCHVKAGHPHAGAHFAAEAWASQTSHGVCHMSNTVSLPLQLTPYAKWVPLTPCSPISLFPSKGTRFPLRTGACTAAST